jgi:hypothetical protein
VIEPEAWSKVLMARLLVMLAYRAAFVFYAISGLARQP